MKTLILTLIVAVWSGMLFAESPTAPKTKPQEPKPEQDLGAAKIERPIDLKKAIPPESAWAGAHYGVIGQLLQAPNVLTPLNPFAKPSAGVGEGNLSQDTVTGRVMGFRLVKFEF